MSEQGRKMRSKQQSATEREQVWRVCYTWMLENRHRLKSYALLQADGETDVELLVDRVVERVCEAVLSGRVSAEESALLPYTLRSIHNMAETMRKTNLRRKDAERSYHTNQDTTAMDEKEAEYTALQRAVLSLPQAQLTVVELKIWQKNTFKEISTILQEPESTVRSRYLAALQQIKSILNEAHEDEN